MQDIKNKLSQVDKLLFVIDGKPYALSLRNNQFGNCNDLSWIVEDILEKYFLPMQAIAKKPKWDIDDEQDLAHFSAGIYLRLGEYNCTPEQTMAVLESFDDNQLAQLLEQLDLYFRIRPFFCKYKVKR